MYLLPQEEGTRSCHDVRDVRFHFGHFNWPYNSTHFLKVRDPLAEEATLRKIVMQEYLQGHYDPECHAKITIRTCDNAILQLRV